MLNKHGALDGDHTLRLGSYFSPTELVRVQILSVTGPLLGSCLLRSIVFIVPSHPPPARLSTDSIDVVCLFRDTWQRIDGTRIKR